MNIVSTITHERDVQEFYITVFGDKYEISIFPQGKSFEGDVIYTEGKDHILIENKSSSPEAVLRKSLEDIMARLKNKFKFDENVHNIHFVIDGACPHIKVDEVEVIVRSIISTAIVSKI
jgi:hypothetical protein